MKKTFLKIMLGMLLLTIGLSGISCSREKTPEKAVLPPDHSKMIETYKKEIEKTKKIVVARVNGVELNMKDLVDIKNQIAPKYMKDAGQRSPETDARVNKEALDALVFTELAYQEAIKQGLKAMPEDVDAAMKKIKTDLVSEIAYKDYLENSGMTEASLIKKIERAQLIRMINTKEILQKTKVNEKLVRNTYNAEKASFVLPESFLVEDVIIQIVKGDDVSSMNKAKETLSFIKNNNNDISKLALDKSRVVRNGEVTEQEYPNIFGAAAKMKAGDLSSVIKESDGLHIIKLLKKNPRRQLSFEDARVQIEHKLMLPVINKRKQQWENELKKNAKIELINAQGVYARAGKH